MKDTINVEMIKENPDGSAEYKFDLTPEMMEALLRFGIIKAIEAGIKEAQEKYTPLPDAGVDLFEDMGKFGGTIE
jgi:hypothetical protein